MALEYHIHMPDRSWRVAVINVDLNDFEYLQRLADAAGLGTRPWLKSFWEDYAFSNSEVTAFATLLDSAQSASTLPIPIRVLRDAIQTAAESQCSVFAVAD